MANSEHLKRLMEGVEAWNAWRSEEKGRPDLSGAHLSYAQLSGADLSGTDLRHANLSGADLSRANLRKANLCRANLSHANLLLANLRGANISEANVKGANMFGVVRRFFRLLLGKRKRSARRSARGSLRTGRHKLA
jgi:uncharacterized protein YjbI with pentapeptide repeats